MHPIRNAGITTQLKVKYSTNMNLHIFILGNYPKGIKIYAIDDYLAHKYEYKVLAQNDVKGLEWL